MTVSPQYIIPILHPATIHPPILPSVNITSPCLREPTFLFTPGSRLNLPPSQPPFQHTPQTQYHISQHSEAIASHKMNKDTSLSVREPVFCCGSAAPIHTSEDNKLYYNPDRLTHDSIFTSFLRFETRLQQQQLTSSSTSRPKSNVPMPYPLAGQLPGPPTEPWIPHHVLTPEALANNPITEETLYCIHVASRYDFGLAYSHRYYAMPKRLEEDWREISHAQWFASGYPFRMTTDRWDTKCTADRTFFRMTLRPNLGKRKVNKVIEVDVGVRG
jgi:hypothetical protein